MQCAPENKGKIESGVKYAQNNALPGRTFEGLSGQNLFLLEWESHVADKRIHGTTKQQVGRLFNEVEKPRLLPLPASLFPAFEEAQRTVHRDGHIELQKAYYSVPPEYLGRKVFAQGTARVSGSIANQRRGGGGRPLLIGEFGMSTARDSRHGAEEGQRAKLNAPPGTEAEQARLYELVLAAAEKERIVGVLAWCLHDYPIPNPNEAYFGLVRQDGTLKPAAEVLRAAYSRWSRP